MPLKYVEWVPLQDFELEKDVKVLSWAEQHSWTPVCWLRSLQALKMSVAAQCGLLRLHCRRDHLLQYLCMEKQPISGHEGHSNAGSGYVFLIFIVHAHSDWSTREILILFLPYQMFLFWPVGPFAFSHVDCLPAHPWHELTDVPSDEWVQGIHRHLNPGWVLQAHPQVGQEGWTRKENTDTTVNIYDLIFGHSDPCVYKSWNSDLPLCAHSNAMACFYSN